MKHQFLELLADIGFVSVESKRRSSGDDCVLQLSGSEVCDKDCSPDSDSESLYASVMSYYGLFSSLMNMEKTTNFLLLSSVLHYILTLSKL